MTLKRGQPDWVVVKNDFITTSLTFEELGEKYGVKSSTLRNRAARATPKWQEERDAWRQKVTTAANEVTADKRIDELKQFNENDLRVAKAIRAQVAAMIADAQASKKTLPAKDLRAIASAAEAAQRIGRLALGVNTDSHEHSGPNGTPIPTTTVSEERLREYMAAREQFFKDI